MLLWKNLRFFQLGFVLIKLSAKLPQPSIAQTLAFIKKLNRQMIKFFRRIRQRLISENKVGKYFLYAIGEIILVVIGILIALQINNNNDLRKNRAKEIHYLQNIKTDLKLNILELDKYIENRTGFIESANRIIEHFEGKPITDFSSFNADGMKVYTWQKFYQNNNTFQELVNSGNLSLISNDSIKNILLNIESLYKKMKSEEDHFRYDAEILIYEPIYALIDLNPLVNNFTYKVSNGQAGKDVTISKENYKGYLENTKIKNGFLMAVLEFGIMNDQMREMKLMSEELIRLIDQEKE